MSMITFSKELLHEIQDDEIFYGAAALAYYLLLSLFPAMIFLLSILPYLPIENLHQEIMDFISGMLPQQTASMFSGVLSEITTRKRSGLLSFGALATIWASSSGLYAVMQMLNRTYDVKESRPFWKARGISILMTLVFGLMIISAFTLIIFGQTIQNALSGYFGYASVWVLIFQVFRWVVILALLLLGFALIYYFGPDVKQEFRFITPGSLIGVLLFLVASLGFQFYVNRFSDYAKTYGSLGAVIVLMLWLYLSGLVILFGSEINALIEHHHAQGKDKGEKLKGQNRQKASSKPLPV